MSWNRGKQGVSPKKRTKNKKPAGRLARKAIMLAERAAKKGTKGKKKGKK